MSGCFRTRTPHESVLDSPWIITSEKSAWSFARLDFFSQRAWSVESHLPSSLHFLTNSGRMGTDLALHTHGTAPQDELLFVLLEYRSFHLGRGYFRV